MATSIGIDLGTTFSVVSYINSDGRPEAIKNDSGLNITPSVIDLRSEPPIIGAEAKSRQEEGHEGVYAFFKRDMGNANILYTENGKEYSPVDLSAIVLRYLKQYAEQFLGQTVGDAVITVPAYFNNMQREATIAAGRQAGLNVLRIINEPTAAALAYGVRPSSKAAKVLVYDLGGGTFDVSLVDISPTELSVITTAGDHNLGGKDWDDRILQHLSTSFERQFGLEILDGNNGDISALMVLAENTKKALTDKQSTKVTVQAKGKTASYEVTRTQFETATADLMTRTTSLVEQVLKDAKLSWQDVQGVLLVGGSTRMPMVKTYVEHMSGKPAMQGINPDEAVAHGAAIQAAMDIEAQKTASSLSIAGRKVIKDVIGNSLGMIAVDEANTHYLNSIIIQKNLPVPCNQARPYQLRISRKGDNKLEVFMTQGETSDPFQCAYLGKYVFSNIPSVQTKVAVIDITYAYNVSGVVEVSAVERSTQQPLTLTIEPLPTDVPDRFGLPPSIAKVREHLSIYMAFDLSGSMSGDPLDKAREAASSFVAQCDLSGTSIGVIEFSDAAQTTVRVNQNARDINRGIKNLEIGRTGGTGNGNDAQPFDEVFKQLQNAKGLRYGIVLTDGMWSNQPLAIQRAKRCHEAGIEIIAIGFGGADETFLKQISSSSEYSFFTDLNNLTETFNTIAQELTEGGGTMNKENMQQRRRGLGLFR